MAWRDQLREASFRGAAFMVDGHERTLGRRLEVHEYPQRDRPYVEDLGRAARRYAIDAYVLGPDYMAARDALAGALDAEGPGLLVHPYLGSLTVACQEAQASERAEEGGMAVFRITFVEADEPPAPETVEDTQAAAAAAADTAEDQLVEGFELAWAPEMRDFAADALADLIAAAADALGGLALAPLAEAGRFAVGRAAAALRADAGALLGRPLDLGRRVMGLAGLIRQAAPAAADGFRLMGRLMDFGAALPAVAATTPARMMQAANQAALVGLVRHAGAVGAVRAVAGMTFAAYDDAAAVRDQLADRLDDLAAAAADEGDDQGYGALTALRLAMARDLTARGADLARVAEITPAATLPALVLAHRVYGDALRADELVDRNRSTQPGFVAGGTPLQVLTGG